MMSGRTATRVFCIPKVQRLFFLHALFGHHEISLKNGSLLNPPKNENKHYKQHFAKS